MRIAVKLCPKKFGKRYTQQTTELKPEGTGGSSKMKMSWNHCICFPHNVYGMAKR